jgi:nickel/cobalt transporter (NicO) family protein
MRQSGGDDPGTEGILTNPDHYLSCEPLIPLLMFPAAEEGLLSAFWIALVFGSVTLVTMMAVVFAASLGLAQLPIKPIERFSHALAGFAICLCGIAVRSGF